MTENTVYINAVIDVRVEESLFHFSLGQWMPTRSGQPEFVLALRGVLPISEAANMFGYLVEKARPNVHVADEVVASEVKPSGQDPKVKMDGRRTLISESESVEHP